MSDDSANGPKSIRPHFSLSTVLFVVALIACGIIIWRQTQQVVLLRQDVQRFRTESGYPQIADPSKVHIIAAEKRDNSQDWWWRLCIPTGAKYRVNIYSGPWPADAYVEPGHVLRPELFKKLHDEGSGMLVTYSLPHGEFQLNAAMHLQGTNASALQHYFEVKPGGTLEHIDWWPTRGKFGRHLVSVITGGSELRILQTGQPALLMQLLETKIGAKPAEDGSNCIAVWIDQKMSQSAGEAGIKKTEQVK